VHRSQLTRSSANTISGDHGLTDARRLRWLLNALSHHYQPEVGLDSLRLFKPKLGAYPSTYCTPMMTPSRVLSNLFWLQVQAKGIWRLLERISVIDCGCGDGSYSRILQQALGEIDSYLGFDLEEHARWSQFSVEGSVNFTRCDVAQIRSSFFDQHNLIVSQSAIEHFPEDLKFFQRIAESVSARSDPVIQVHLIPPPTIWRQFGFHGYRGYTSSGIKLIADLFGSSSEYRIFALGGPACLDVHYRFVFDLLSPDGKDERYSHRELYVERLKAAILADSSAKSVSVSESCFLALVIHSNCSRGSIKIWDALGPAPAVE
jgi:hypothetical protein